MTTSTQWQLARDAAERYEQMLVPAILGPAARALVEWTGIGTGESVLDVGCGTGAAARFAAESVGDSGRVVGADINAGMIAVARSLPVPAGRMIEWFENSAYDLPFTDGEFDVALCAQTLQFLEKRPLALAEMQRVLKRGGRIALSLWCPIEQSPYFQALVQAVEEYIGQETATGLVAAFSLSDPDTIHALVAEGGFENVIIEVKDLDLELPPPHEFVPRHVSATPMAAGFHAATEAARQAVIDSVSEQLKSHKTDTGIQVPFRTFLVMATRG